MQTVAVTNWVGTSPGTSTIRLGQEGFQCLGAPPIITEEQYRAADIALRERELNSQSSAARWQSVAAIASASLTALAIVAGFIAWRQTGKLSITR